MPEGEPLDPLVQELLVELAEPALLVDRRHGVRFATGALRRLLGLEDSLPSCDTLLVPPPRPAGSSCCWDALDVYREQGGSALLPLRRRDGSALPALCRISVVDAGGRPCFLHIAVEPLEGPDPLALRLFRAIRTGLEAPQAFEGWLASFFAAESGLRFSWLDPERADDALHLAVREGLGRVGVAAPFDVLVEERGQPRLARVIAAHGPTGERVALITSREARLPGTLVRILWAAVRAAAEPVGAVLGEVPATAGLAALTEREQEVLALVARGLTDREIGETLGASPHTVRNHLRHIMEKCGVHRRVQLATIARSAPGKVDRHAAAAHEG